MNETTTQKTRDAEVVEDLHNHQEDSEQTALQAQSTTATTRYEPQDLGELWRYSKIVVNSQLCPSHISRPEDAVLIVQRGAELGLSAGQSLQNMYVVDGKISMKADLAVGLVKASPLCRYFRKVESTRDRAAFETHRQGEPEPQHFEFTWQDAQTAGLADQYNFQNYPKQMLMARAKIALARLVYPDLLAGIYTPEELDADVDAETGEPLDAEFEASGDTGGQAEGQHTEPDPDHREHEEKDKRTARIADLLADAGLDADGDRAALAEWACEEFGVSDWASLSIEQLDDIGQRIAQHSARGGERSSRRLWLDTVLDVEPGADWSATGYDGSDDWRALNGRWRTAVSEAVDGEDTERRYHEAAKSRAGDVPSFKDLSCEALMVDIGELEALSPEHDDPAGISPRLEYIQSEVDEYLPASEELDLEGDEDGGASDDDDGEGRWERDSAPRWAKAQKRRGMGRNRNVEVTRTFYDLDALEGHDGPAGILVSAVRGPTSAKTIQKTLRLIVRRSDADHLDGVAEEEWSRWVDAATTSDQPDQWLQDCLDARKFVDPGSTAPPADVDLDKLAEEQTTLAYIVRLARESVDDDVVVDLLGWLCERTDVAELEALAACDLGEYADWLDPNEGRGRRIRAAVPGYEEGGQ